MARLSQTATLGAFAEVSTDKEQLTDDWHQVVMKKVKVWQVELRPFAAGLGSPTVTRPGSPPSAAMWCCTQRKASP